MDPIETNRTRPLLPSPSSPISGKVWSTVTVLLEQNECDISIRNR